MSIKSTKKQTYSEKSASAAFAPSSPVVYSYSITGFDELALDVAGGQTIVISGTGFKPGATVNIGAVSVGVVSFVDSNTLSITSPALSAGTYTLYVSNTDGGTGILTPGIIYSTFPSWVTASGNQGSYYETQTINNSFVASSDTAIANYTLASGTLPPGSTLSSSGVLTGTAPVDGGSTTYTFSIKATDSELQDSTRSFSLTINTDVVTWVAPANNTVYNLLGNQAMDSVILNATDAAGYNLSYTANALPTGVSISSGIISGTPTNAETVTTLLTATAATTNRTATRIISWSVTIGDIYWKNVTMLLNGTTKNPSFTTDASTTHNAWAINGEVRPVLYNPYNLGYNSVFFSYSTGSASNLLTPYSTGLVLTGNFTIELWFYPTATGGMLLNMGGGLNIGYASYEIYWDTTYINFAASSTNTSYDIGSETGTTGRIGTPTLNAWNHVAVTRSGNDYKGFLNGVLGYSQTVALTPYDTGTRGVSIGSNYVTGWGAGYSPDNTVAGWISNVRIVKGTALYTAAFTPPTSPLTAVSGTSLLACHASRYIDGSFDNLTLTPNGNSTTIYPNNPFQTSSTASSRKSYSVYMVNTGNNIYPTFSGVALGSGAFTAELWYYNPTVSGAVLVYLFTGTAPAFRLQINAGTSIRVYGGASMTTVTWTVPSWQYDTWYHIAYTRDSSGNATVFVNGVRSSSGVQSDPNNYTNKTTSLVQASPRVFADVRIVAGTAVYDPNSSTITVPTSPLTAVSGTQLLTAQNNVAKDNSTNNFTMSYGDGVIRTTGPYTIAGPTISNLGSGYFDGTGDFLSTPASPVFALAGDYTVEAWVYRTDSGVQRAIVDLRGGANLNVLLYMNTSNTISVYNSTSTWLTSNTLLPLNAWVHVALCRIGTTATLYINGVADASATNSEVNVSLGPVYIGSQNGVTTFDWLGYISDVRIINGTGIYTSSFVPPADPLTLTSKTVALTCQYNGGATNSGIMDRSNLSQTMTRAGNATLGTFSPYNPTGWSVYFDGTASYLTGTGITIGTGDVTFEFWLYFTGNDGTRYDFIQGDTGTWLLYRENTNTINWYVASSLISASFTLASHGNRWMHIAVCRASGNLRLFIDGVQAGSTATSDTNNYTCTTSTIGKNAGGAFYMNGYMSNFRIVTSALYTSNFTPPTTSLVPIANTVLLTLQDNRAVDRSPTNCTYTGTGTPQFQTFSPFGSMSNVPKSYSVYFDGTGDYLAVANNTGFQFGTGDFTIECWVWTRNGQTEIVAMNSGTAGNWAIVMANNIYWQSAWGVTWVTYTTNIPTLNTWNHIAVVRSSGTVKIYLNGVNDGTATDSNDYNGTAALGIGGNPTAASAYGFLNGSISNLRIVKGTAVYTSNFTPSTSPLTAISGTVLLTCNATTMVDSSDNKYAITVNGDAKPRYANPFGATVTQQVALDTSIHGGSVYFDGTTDSITIPATQTFGYGTGDFTMEVWCYIPKVQAAYGDILSFTLSTTVMGIRWSNSGFGYKYQVGTLNSSATCYSSSATQQQNVGQWRHMAFTRQSGTIRMFLDGVQQYFGSGVNPSTYPSTSVSLTTNMNGATSLTIGNGTLAGYVSDARLIIGTALYTSSFIPPTSSLPSTVTVGTRTYTAALLLNTANGAIIDAHGGNNAETIGNTQLQTESPYEGTYYSNYFDGTGDYLRASANAAFSYGTGDFTIEAWIYPTSYGSGTTYRYICGAGASGQQDQLNINNTGDGKIAYYDGATGFVTTNQFTLNAWNHVAVARSSGTLRIFINGIQGASGASSTNITIGATNPFYIGNRSGGGDSPEQSFIGYISNVRVTKGQALYTSAFTPSTTPLTVTSQGATAANVSLLSCQSNKFIDTSTNAFTLTRGGDVSVKSFNPFQQNTGKSLYFDGTGDSLKISSNPNSAIGSSDFTVETWVWYATAGVSSGTIVDFRSGSTGTNFLIYLGTTGALTFYATGAARITGGTMTTGRWYHVAVSRASGNTRMFVDGTQVGSTFVDTYKYLITDVYVGSDYLATGLMLNGYIKDLRITKGIARYTTTFTPSSALLQIK